MDICKWCKKEVDIPFEETQDKKKRIYFKGKCPSCGKTNKKWPAKTSEDIEPDVSEEAPTITPMDMSEEIPETSQEDIEPDVSEEAIVPVTQEVITEPEDPEDPEEDEVKKKWGGKDYALVAFIGITIILVIILIYQATKNKEAGHGQKEA